MRHGHHRCHCGLSRMHRFRFVPVRFAIQEQPNCLMETVQRYSDALRESRTAYVTVSAAGMWFTRPFHTAVPGKTNGILSTRPPLGDRRDLCDEAGLWDGVGWGSRRSECVVGRLRSCRALVTTETVFMRVDLDQIKIRLAAHDVKQMQTRRHEKQVCPEK